MTGRELAQCAASDIRFCSPEELVDLQNVVIDRTLPVAARVSQFFTQVGNPYLFQVDGMVIKVSYGGEKTLHDSLIRLLSPDLAGSEH